MTSALQVESDVKQETIEQMVETGHGVYAYDVFYRKLADDPALFRKVVSQVMRWEMLDARTVASLLGLPIDGAVLEAFATPPEPRPGFFGFFDPGFAIDTLYADLIPRVAGGGLFESGLGQIGFKGSSAFTCTEEPKYRFIPISFSETQIHYEGGGGDMVTGSLMRASRQRGQDWSISSLRAVTMMFALDLQGKTGRFHRTPALCLGNACPKNEHHYVTVRSWDGKIEFGMTERIYQSSHYTWHVAYEASSKT